MKRIKKIRKKYMNKKVRSVRSNTQEVLLIQFYQSLSLVLEDLVLLVELALTLLDNGQLNTGGNGELDERGVTLANDEHVGGTGGEPLATIVTNVNNVESSRVLLTVLNNTDTPQVSTTGDHALLTVLELDVVNDLVGDEVELDGVVDSNGGVRVTDGTAIVGDNEGDSLRSEGPLLDLEELELEGEKM